MLEKVKEKVKNNKEIVLGVCAGGLCVTAYVVGYIAGQKIESLRITYGIDAMLREDPSLEPLMASAIEKAQKSLGM